MSDLKEACTNPAAHKAEARKLELVAKIRELKAEVGKVNQELHAAGVSVNTIVSCW